ncbi:uncharacterized protein LOC116189070 [Punica granatum]|uniref:Holocarboxylase synthetase n=2 Tax=Punica granatum TaxID=22663 RepID=A0A218VV58_PUNGR|nr:uncharacterized protein LOC116189070 [Punica granatum]OWM63970.1 hypothetical protein CDL15_Pgr012011 [Punica granatum]PKI72018.1 hypothetical protein CRG98_007564 [Punica granatum]
MGKKRKSIATSLDEVDRTMYASFCSAANSLSQLYTQAMNHQKLSFQAGERHGLEKLYQWLLRQQEGGARVSTSDVLNYIQNELDYPGEEPLVSPRAPQHQQLHPVVHFTGSGLGVSSASSGPVAGQGPRFEHYDQPKNSVVFANALSSPIRRSLQPYHVAQGGYYPSNGAQFGNGSRNNDPNFFHNQNRDSNPLSSSDSAMDMHADSPAHEST